MKHSRQQARISVLFERKWITEYFSGFIMCVHHAKYAHVLVRNQVLNRNGMLKIGDTWFRINERSHWQITLVDIEQIKIKKNDLINFRIHTHTHTPEVSFGLLCAMDAHRNIHVCMSLCVIYFGFGSLLPIMIIPKTLNYVNGLAILFSPMGYYFFRCHRLLLWLATFSLQQEFYANDS